MSLLPDRSRPTLIFLLYLALTAVYTWPLLPLSGSMIAADPGDPILNASILWWNATTVPFSEAWWNPPYFYPSGNISAFTENLQGLTPVSTPIFWLTRNPLTTYNLTLFLTWPLSAFATYLLVRHLTAREDAGLVAGLAYGFSPYRTAELGHLQMVASYGLPLVLLGLHGYLTQRRLGWLVMFGAAWLLQSLANGYLMLFGAVLVALWLCYFCSTRSTMAAAPRILTAWAIASLPLVPVMLRYREVHEQFGLRRNLSDPLGFSVPVRAFGEVSQLVRVWHQWLPESGDNLFPGITAGLLVLIAVGIAFRRRHRADGSRRRSAPGSGLQVSSVPDISEDPNTRRQTRLRAAVLVVCGVSAGAVLFTLLNGPWQVAPFGIVVRMARIDRGLFLAVVSGIALVALSRRAKDALGRRSPFLFYAVTTIAMAAFSCGPVLRVGTAIVFDPAPYRLLMALPGFTGLRVPTRFWMLGVLCLAVAAGLAFARVRPIRHRARRVMFVAVVLGLMIDGWLVRFPMAAAPELWPGVERRDRAEPILELPLGPEWDAAATYRSIWHRRRVVNGVSGYDPPHYDPLQAGLNAHDPAVLLALATLGAFDVVVDGRADADGSWGRYVSSVAGEGRTASDGARTAYRVGARLPQDVRTGSVLPIAGVTTFLHDPGAIADGRIESEWGDGPQRPDQWVTVDLGVAHRVGGVTHALGEYARDFPRLLAIETSVDGAAWTEVWRGGTVGQAVLAAIHEPRHAHMRFAFPAVPARFVRLRQLAHHRNLWRIAELRVHAPAQ
jgi:hypothetical protein